MRKINLTQTILTVAICTVFTVLNFGGKVIASDPPAPVEVKAGSFTVDESVNGTEYVMTNDGTITLPECVINRHFSVMNDHEGNVIADAGYGGAIFVWNAATTSIRLEQTAQNVDRNSVSQFLCIGNNTWRVASNGTWGEPE